LKNIKYRTDAAQQGYFNPRMTNRLTFEYHAFVYASVRCINHIAKLLACICFNIDNCKSINNFKKLLERKINKQNQENSEFINSIKAQIGKYPNLEKLYRNKDKNINSIRDHITHHEYLNTGSLRVKNSQAKLFGKLPDDIDYYNGKSEPHEYRLSGIMDCQLQQIYDFVNVILDLVIDSYLPTKRQ
jgi:hypothetical protein